SFGPELCYVCHLVMLHLLFHSLFLIAYSFWFRAAYNYHHTHAKCPPDGTILKQKYGNSNHQIISIFATDYPERSREILETVYPSMDVNSTTHRSVNFFDPYSAPTDFSAISTPFIAYTFIVFMRRKSYCTAFPRKHYKWLRH
ncbi:hypothetical protein PFISCL1PPCAC_14089, partial [Pristionchus fissidentatus]